MKMNKTNMLMLAGLMFFSINNGFAMGTQEREILYTLHELGQNMAEVPMVTQNIDMFLGVFEMNIQITEAKLAAADKNFKRTLRDNAVLLVGCPLAQAVLVLAAGSIKSSLVYSVQHSPAFIASWHTFLRSIEGIAFIAGKLFVGLNVYNAWNKRLALTESLALDKSILDKLQEIKESTDQGAEPAGNILLKSTE
jgi:hypothetical protein